MDVNQPTQPVPVDSQTPGTNAAPPPVESYGPPKKKMPALVGILLILLLVALLGGGTYLMNMKKSQPAQKAVVTSTPPTPTPSKPIDKTLPWQTYTNTSIGFSFLYPGEWTRQGTQLAIPIGTPCQQCDQPTPSVTITVLKNTKNMPLKDFIYKTEVDKLTELGEEESATTSATSIVELYKENPYNTDKTIPSFFYTSMKGDESSVYYEKGTDVLSIQFSSINPDIIQRMLSSFKFGDPRQAATTNWKKFTNKQYAFSFKYPTEFSVTEKKETIQSTNFHKEKIAVTRFTYTFTTGKKVNGASDWSGFAINVEPTNGRTITQEFSGQQGAGGKTQLKTILNTAGADEAFDVTNIENGGPVHRVKNLFFAISTLQNNNILPDRSDDIMDYFDTILSTLSFSN